MTNSLSDQDVKRVDAYWRAANDLSVGQIYLLDNPLLRSGRGARLSNVPEVQYRYPQVPRWPTTYDGLDVAVSARRVRA